MTKPEARPGQSSVSRRPAGSGVRAHHRSRGPQRPTNHRRRVTVIAPPGEIDMAVAGDFRRCLARAAERGTDVVVDLTGVVLIDGVCLSVLVEARNEAVAQDRGIYLAAPSRLIARVLRITTLDSVFPIFPDAARALGHLNALGVVDRPAQHPTPPRGPES